MSRPQHKRKAVRRHRLVRFSQRRGYKPAARAIQKDSMNEDLRNSLWSILDLAVWEGSNFMWRPYGEGDIGDFSRALWFQFYKLPTDTRPSRSEDILAEIRENFFRREWYEVYDFLEWMLNYLRNDDLINSVNHVLQRELAGYRFVGGVFTDITDEQEVALLDEALSDDAFAGVRGHLRTALQHLANRQNPDYRNSIKESVSAVESMAQAITGNRKASLGDALSELEKRGHLHPALKKGFSSLYGYASDEGGIRHAMLDEPNLEASDAKFFLLSCTSFINYLKARI